MRHRWEILKQLIEDNDCYNIAEIGVSRGINAVNLLVTCRQIEKMYLVDLPNNVVFDFGMFADAKVHSKIQCLFVGSENAPSFIYEPLDLVFIDAEHSYEAVMNDIHIWLPKIRKGGIICGHDYIPTQPGYGVVEAVDELFPDRKLEDDILEDGKLKIWWTKV